MSYYNFGVYHWRQRLQTMLSALGITLLSWLLWRRSASRRIRFGAMVSMAGAVISGGEATRRMLVPPPWTLERYKYDALASHLSFENANRALDIGCGTGRSLVGLAPAIPDSCTVVGLDVFDNRIILGNAPALARRNGRTAGIDVSPVAGDAARLPIATDSQDVVTACRVLHDLPRENADRTLREARRVCASDGILGVLELPITPDGVAAPSEEYWHERVTEAGFDIETIERLDRKRRDDQYILIVATPS